MEIPPFADIWDGFQSFIEFLQISAFGFSDNFKWPAASVPVLFTYTHLAFESTSFTIWWSLSIACLLFFYFLIPAAPYLSLENPEFLESFLWSFGLSALAGFLFVPIVENFVWTFVCENGFMTRVPDIVCNSAGHISLLLICIVAVVKAGDLEEFDSHAPDKRFRIRTSVRYYPTKNLVFKLVFIILGIALYASPALLGILYMILPLAAAGWTTYMMPFADDRVNYFTAGKYMVNVWTFICSLISVSSDDTNSYVSTYLLIISILFFAIGVGLTVYRGKKWEWRPGDDTIKSVKFWEAKRKDLQELITWKFAEEGEFNCSFRFHKGDESIDAFVPLWGEFQSLLQDVEGQGTEEHPITEMVLIGRRDLGITYSKEGWKKITELVANDDNLTKLRFETDEITPETAQIIINALKTNSKIHSLNFFDDQISPDTAKLLVTELILKTENPLTEFNLGKNPIAADSQEEIMALLGENPKCQISFFS